MIDTLNTEKQKHSKENELQSNNDRNTKKKKELHRINANMRKNEYKRVKEKYVWKED